ncbi:MULTISPECIES: TIGR03086 family metal-binding protein [Thermocrispum]|jgi:uncharacterized protein (TIGR03086 family)|uniref:TIGR03086 family metal-binding protein n=1 Tax=Thermocrispum agreste TaxID=37925 RepID=A0ABD6FEY8_9PSEU|nr:MULTISPECIES: TIGR03086 family metal-binding protein [Thermocrispum]
MLDLAPAAQRLAAVVGQIGDDQLAAPTPCEKYQVSGLVAHVLGLAVAFRLAAVKDPAASADPPSEDPDPTAVLPEGWREELARRLDALVAAWREPAAWHGQTEVGGVSLPAEQAGVVALQELVVHGWDLATATGQHYDLDENTLRKVFVALDGSVDENGTPGLFAPPVPVPMDAPLLDRTIALTGRDPKWRPAQR